METGLTNVASVKAFWPDVVNEFPAAILDAQIANYIFRAEILINRLIVVDLTRDHAVEVAEMAANLLTQRLIYKDKHPATSADAANVIYERVHGVSHEINSKRRDLQGVVGEEIAAMLEMIAEDGGIGGIGMQTENVFMPPSIVTTDDRGNTHYVFDPRIDDNLEETISEQLGINE